MTPEFYKFCMNLRRSYLAFVASLEELLGIVPRCPHCNKPLREKHTTE